MKKDKKQQQQIVMLSLVVAIIVGVIAYFYWPVLLPVAVTDGSVPNPSAPRLNVSTGEYGKLLDRQDFRGLEAFGDVPVKVLPSSGNPKPFVSSAEAEGRTEQ